MRPEKSSHNLITMKQLLISGLLVFIVVSYGNQEYCPKMCICNVVQDMNSADCSGQKLINAQIEMAKEVEILDLSKNDISILDDKNFNELKHLVYLILANNSIHTIDSDTFEKLKKLQYLDLSYNRLSVFDEKIIENNHNLITVNLQGNKFMYLGDEPILKSQSVQNLDIHNSQLTRVTPSLLKNLPNLQTLDLSHNLLITLDKDTFKHNKRLKQINLKNNPWNCDSNLDATLKWLRRKHVDIDIKECPNPRTKPMFERIIQMSPLADKQGLPEKFNNIRIESVWKTRNINLNHKSCPLDNALEACDMFEWCKQNFTNFFKEVQLNLNYANKIRHKFHTQIFGIEFYVGIAFGLTIGGTSVYICMIFLAMRQNSKKRRRQILNECDSGITIINNNPTERIDEHRRPNQNRTASTNTDRDVRIVEHQPTTSFFASLFQRRTPRRYYQAFNENATNLVRRLSQSRLFLNHSRQYGDSNASRQNSNELNSTSDITRLIDNRRNLDTPDNINYETILPTAPTEDLIERNHLRRPETPPPAYKDIIS